MKEVRTNSIEGQIIPLHILPIIILSQFAGTSLWFAGNAIANELISSFSYPLETLGYLTSSVQLGFIAGTLIFAYFTLADRFSPVRLFAVCSFIAAGFNFLIIFTESLPVLLSVRFLTGFFLAGIYPIGMKISADWYGSRLGKALGYLVGALVLGTALPHFIRGFTISLSWERVIIFTSIIASIGGLLMLLGVSDGPLRKRSAHFNPRVILSVFKVKDFRNAAFGYFGHMWELYAVWAFIPLILTRYQGWDLVPTQISFFSFAIIAIGTAGCIIGGYISVNSGSARVALTALIVSGICCLISPFIPNLPPSLFLIIMFLWGFSVVADSPQFSTIVARTSPPESVGSALTIVNSIGFALTIPSIELINYLIIHYSSLWPLSILAIGPFFGIISISSLAKRAI